MDDNAELQAKIAALAGRINRHKASESETAQPYARAAHPQAYGTLLSTTRPYETETFQDQNQYGYHSWAPQRGTPYGVYRGRRRGYGTASPVHRNRTLVLNSSGQNNGVAGDSVSTATSATTHTDDMSGSGWVSKRDRHMQLINNAVYEQKTQQRTQAMEETRQQKLRLREEREKLKLQSHLHSLATYPKPTTSESVAHELLVKDIKFVVTDGGSKLIKVVGKCSRPKSPPPNADPVPPPDPINLTKETPKRTTIGGVTFLRSKHGNLYRAGFIKTKRSGSWPDILMATTCANQYQNSATDIKKIAQPCPQFTATGTITPSWISHNIRGLHNMHRGPNARKLTWSIGTCTKGPLCRYEHDPDKVAICRDFLQTGKCQAGLNCDLSHDPAPERVPACLHFLRGNCTNPDCRYAHVRTNPSAPVCRTFATLGYCSKGAECAERHVFECPDFTNKGICRNKKCRLPHVHRAGQLRKAAAMQQSESDEGQSSDISSDDDVDAYDSNDVDSDDFEEDVAMSDTHRSELSQQVDFVKF